MSPALFAAYDAAMGTAPARPAAGHVTTVRAKPHWDWQKRERVAAARRRPDGKPDDDAVMTGQPS